jgi:hypothetical protein
MSTSSNSRPVHPEYIGDCMQSAEGRPAAGAAFPSIARGRHAGPDDGACLMELASLLAGEPWTDRPGSVHPVLASVARAVNDRVGDDTRTRLAPLVPVMLHTAGTGSRGCAAVVVACADAALDLAEHCDVATRCGLEAARRRARRILAGRALSGRLRPHRLGAPLAGLLDWAYCHGAVLRTAEAVAVVANADGGTGIDFADTASLAGDEDHAAGAAASAAAGPAGSAAASEADDRAADERLARLLGACATAIADSAGTDAYPTDRAVAGVITEESRPVDATLVGT